MEITGFTPLPAAIGGAMIGFSAVLLMALGGLLVGYGTRLGSGCTSGHGDCGIARLSKRSFVATAMFMVIAIVTVFVLHHAFGF